MADAETWHRILDAIERLQAKVPAGGENVHYLATNPPLLCSWTAAQVNAARS
jgi:hypothetical protein